MRKRIIFAGLTLLPGCAMDGAITVHRPCDPCAPVYRACNGPLGTPQHAAPPPPAVYSTPTPAPTPSEPEIIEAVPPIEDAPAPAAETPRPTTRWKAVRPVAG